MFLCNARSNTNLGFNLAELSIMLVVAGILAAIGIPSVLQMFEKFQSDSAFNQVRGAIEQAQLQAIRLSRTCTITIDETNKEITLNDPDVDTGCLLEELSLPNSTEIRTNRDDGNVAFNFRGNTNTQQTIVVYDEDQFNRKCLVISNGIGMIRGGDYEGNLDADISPSSCNTQ